MAAPTYITASTGSTDAGGAWSHTAAAPSAAGNILIVQVVQDGTGANTISIDSVIYVGAAIKLSYCYF